MAAYGNHDVVHRLHPLTRPGKSALILPHVDNPVLQPWTWRVLRMCNHGKAAFWRLGLVSRWGARRDRAPEKRALIVSAIHFHHGRTELERQFRDRPSDILILWRRRVRRTAGSEPKRRDCENGFSHSNPHDWQRLLHETASRRSVCVSQRSAP
jgi:hypothetical protein